MWCQVTSVLVMGPAMWMNNPNLFPHSLCPHCLCLLSHWEHELSIIQAGHMISLPDLWGGPVTALGFPTHSSLRWALWCSYKKQSIHAIWYSNKKCILDLYIIGCSKLQSISWLWGYWWRIIYHISGPATARINKPMCSRCTHRQTDLGIQILNRNT